MPLLLVLAPSLYRKQPRHNARPTGKLPSAGQASSPAAGITQLLLNSTRSVLDALLHETDDLEYDKAKYVNNNG